MARKKRRTTTAGRKKTARRGGAGKRVSRQRAGVKRTTVAKRKTAARAAATRARRRQPTGGEPSRLAAAVTQVRGVAAGAAAAIAERMPWANHENDPIALLEADHRRFEALLRDGEATTERGRKRRGELLRTLADALSEHELLEEKILYPALKPHAEARDIVLEGYQEHHVADVIVKELQNLNTADERWGAKFKVLKENIEHHIEEEEGEMFRTARAVFSREELNEMGKRMRNLRRQPADKR